MRNLYGPFLVICTLEYVISQALMQSIDKVAKRAGEDAVMQCLAFSLKDSDVAWLRYLTHGGMDTISIMESIQTMNPRLTDGRLKYSINRYKTTKRINVFDLTIRQLTAADSGIYQCILMKKGQSANKWPTANGTLLVQYSPNIRQSYTSSWVDVAENGTAVLKCNADGVPTPRISWIRSNGRPFNDGQLTRAGKHMQIENVQESDRGVYRCRAENDVRPSDVADIMVDIHSRPRVTPFIAHVGQSPGMNLPADLTCLISGKPQPILVWYKIEGDRRRELLNDESHRLEVFDAVLVGPNIREGDRWFTLRLLNVQQSDYGLYACEARNIYGTTHSLIKLFYTTTCQGRGCLRHMTVVDNLAENEEAGDPQALYAKGAQPSGDRIVLVTICVLICLQIMKMSSCL